jgi:hypothetical protein
MESSIIKDVVPYILSNLEIKDLISYSQVSKTCRKASCDAWKLKLQREVVPSYFQKLIKSIHNDHLWSSYYIKNKCKTIKIVICFITKMIMDRKKLDVGSSSNRYKWSLIMFNYIAENWWLITHHKTLKEFQNMVYIKLKEFGKDKNVHHQKIYHKFQCLLPSLSYDGIKKLYQ